MSEFLSYFLAGSCHLLYSNSISQIEGQESLTKLQVSTYKHVTALLMPQCTAHEGSWGKACCNCMLHTAQMACWRQLPGQTALRCQELPSASALHQYRTADHLLAPARCTSHCTKHSVPCCAKDRPDTLTASGHG